VYVLKDSLQRRERVEFATNKVTFWGTQNDETEIQSGDVFETLLTVAPPQPTPVRSHIKIGVIECVMYNCTWSSKSVNFYGLPELSLSVLRLVFNCTTFIVLNAAVINSCLCYQLQQSLAL